jgi:hypothetical protein
MPNNKKIAFIEWEPGSALSNRNEKK